VCPGRIERLLKRAKSGDRWAAWVVQQKEADRLLKAVERERSSHSVRITGSSSPSRRMAKKWRTADGGDPFLLATPVPPGPAPRPIAVGRIPDRAAARRPARTGNVKSSGR